MARKTDEQHLAELRKKEAQLKARIQAKEARIRAASRRLETRRKIIIGGMVLAHGEHDDEFKAMIDRLLDQHVTRQHDRQALDLPPLGDRASDVQAQDQDRPTSTANQQFTRPTPDFARNES